MRFRSSAHPLVAIVTPVFNGERHLAETMECVQSLSYPHLVHVISDNCSSDRTADIIGRFASARVPVVARRQPEKRPMARNWNCALEQVPQEADYFWLLCADDLLTRDSIDQVVSIAERDRTVNVVGCRWTATSTCGTELPTDTSVFAGKDVIRRYFRRETMVLSGMNVLFRTSAMDRRTHFYDETLGSFDTDANVRMLLSGNYGFVHEELLYWRQHPDSTSSTVSAKTLDHAADWLVLLDRYGPYVLGHREYLHCRKAFRSYFLRRLLLLRWKVGQTEEFHQYMGELQLHDDPAGFSDFAGAFVDWCLYAIRGRRDQIGGPWRRCGTIKGAGVVVRRARL